jgi:DNA-binding cell septation regulator SpoVG
MSITVLSWRPYEKGALRGFMTIKEKTLGLEVHDVRLLEKNGEQWLGMPAKQYEKDDGTTGYKDYVRVEPRDKRQKFTEEVLKALDEFKTKKHSSIPF